MLNAKQGILQVFLRVDWERRTNGGFAMVERLRKNEDAYNINVRVLAYYGGLLWEREMAQTNLTC